MFVENVKQEMIKNALSEESGELESQYAELYGMLQSAAVLLFRGNGMLNIRIDCAADFVAERASMLISELFQIDCELQSVVSGGFGGRTKYGVLAVDSALVKEMLRYYEIIPFGDELQIHNDISELFVSGEAYLRAYFRGVFLACGYVSEPDASGYILSFSLQSEQYAENFKKLLCSCELAATMRKKGTQFILTMRTSEHISDFLALCRAYSGVLNLEAKLADRDMKNALTRRVNCDTANIARTVNASVRQIEAIEALVRAGMLPKLSETLIAAAQLRLEHPEESLSELSKAASPPVSRSTLDKRLRRLVELGEAQMQKKLSGICRYQR